MTSSNGNIFRVTGHLCGEFTGDLLAHLQWCGALMLSLICVWINGCVNNREAGDLRRYRTHYDVTVFPNTSTTSLCRRNGIFSWEISLSIGRTKTCYNSCIYMGYFSRVVQQTSYNEVFYEMAWFKCTSLCKNGYIWIAICRELWSENRKCLHFVPVNCGHQQFGPRCHIGGKSVPGLYQVGN